jgi:putative membrane protein
MLTTLLAETHGGWWWPIWPIIWLVVIAGLVWFLSRRWRRDRGDGLDRAREVLAERFARGELTVDEYRERLGQLG